MQPIRNIVVKEISKERASTSSMGGGKALKTLPFPPPLMNRKSIFKARVKTNPEFQFNLTPPKAFDSLQSRLFI
jgi:hypothetical protein